MPRASRLIISGKVHELTFRTEEGLPLVCSHYMSAILHGQLASAISQYQVTPCAYTYMGNHVHMLAIVHNPEHLPRFAAYLKRESAHAINNLLGRNQHTVWKDDYDPVPILDAEKVIERLVYFSLNPARAGLIDSIDQYPGLTSWKNGFQERWTLTAKWIPRAAIPPLSRYKLSREEDLKLTRELLESSTKELSVEIDCLAWMSCFAETKHESREAMAKRIRERVYAGEEELRRSRTRPVLGAEALRCQSIAKQHEPTKSGRRMLCLGSDIEQRRSVIGWFKAIFAERKRLKEILLPKEFLNYVIPGLFRPGGSIAANLNPAFAPF